MKNKSRRFPLLRTMGYWLKACAFLAILALPMAVYASGCGEVEYTTEEMIRYSSLIFRGTVLSIGAPYRTPSGGRDVVVKFKIVQAYKGAQGNEIDIVSSSMGYPDCWPRFKVGEETAVFAHRWKDGQDHVHCCFMQKYIKDSAQYDLALEEYRRKRDGLAAEVKRQGPNKELLREQLAFLKKFGPSIEVDKVYTELLQISPGDATTLIERGNFRYRLRRYEDALSDYLAAITVDGQNKEARRGKAICLAILGRSNELGPSDRDFTATEYSDDGTHRISFAGLDLRRASFRDAKFNFLNFSGADLRGADFSGATLIGCNFADAKLTGAKFENLKSADQTTFEKAKLEHANFRGACLRDGVKFGGAVLDNADFSKADLYRASFKNASLKAVNFKKASIGAADFVGADLSEADLSGQGFRMYDMCDARFVKVKLHNANLSKALFSRKPNSPEYSDDENHIISSVISFADAGSGKQFCGVNLTGANLEGADFPYTILDKAIFTDAEYNEKTIWPKGFEPAKIGARKGR